MKPLSSAWQMALAKESAELRDKIDDFTWKTKAEVYTCGFFDGANAATRVSRSLVEIAKNQTGFLAFLLLVSNIAWLVAYVTR